MIRDRIVSHVERSQLKLAYGHGGGTCRNGLACVPAFMYVDKNSHLIETWEPNPTHRGSAAVDLVSLTFSPL